MVIWKSRWWGMVGFSGWIVIRIRLTTIYSLLAASKHSGGTTEEERNMLETEQQHAPYNNGTESTEKQNGKF